MQHLEIDQPPIETPRVLFDISRLFRNRKLMFGTGVDRIDLCYALLLQAKFGERCAFVHAGHAGLCLLGGGYVAEMLRALDLRWRSEPSTQPLAPPGPAYIAAGRVRGALALARNRDLSDMTYFVASHSGLCQRPGMLRRLDPEFRMRRMAYLHDLIPLEHPEYQTPRSIRLFSRFLEELNAAPTHYLVNSVDTANRLRAKASREEWPARSIEVAMPRLRPSSAPEHISREKVRSYTGDPRPYFLMVGTIEPRKNHLLALNIWRELAQTASPPRLCIVGRRGWENENVIDMLDRCEAMRNHVTEFNDLQDCEVQHLIRNCTALLMPSFAEGLGIPVMEAGALGAQAIVSDLPALREVAPPGTVFLDPNDGPGWRAAILGAAKVRASEAVSYAR